MVNAEAAVTVSAKVTHERMDDKCECDILGFLLREKKTSSARAVFSDNDRVSEGLLGSPAQRWSVS